MSLWTFKVLCYLKRHKILIGGLILIILAIVGVSIYNSHQVKKPVLLKQEQVKDPVKLANAIHITREEAQQVVFQDGNCSTRIHLLCASSYG